MNRPMLTLLPLAAAALFASPLVTIAHTPSPPPRRAHHALVYDEKEQRVLLTAGSTPLEQGQRFEFFNDVWALEHCGWRRIGESGERVSGVGLAWDTRRNRLVSFGGYQNGASVGVLREMGDEGWTVVETKSDLALAEPGFVWDAGRSRFVQFGGSAGRGGASGDTWELANGRWTRVAGAGPPARQAHAMVYDAKRRRVVVFGGMAGGGGPGQRPPTLGDTWEYDGRRWTKRDVPGPPARMSPGAAYDAKRGRVILFGGSGPDGFLGDTWAWDGRAWTKLADTGPEPRAMGALAYDRARDRVVMFGGRKGWPDGDLDDTWEWDGERWARAVFPHCDGH